MEKNLLFKGQKPEVKILTLGETSVGKTCILNRYINNKFLKNHMATVGIDFESKKIEIDGTVYVLNIWDTAGQEKYRNITNQYYKGAEGIVLVFDLTNIKTFDKIYDWIDQIKEHLDEEDFSIILVGNKCDLVSNREVSKEEINKFTDETKLDYIEVSALSGENIDEIFNAIIRKIINKRKISFEKKKNFDLNQDYNKKKFRNKCCK